MPPRRSVNERAKLIGGPFDGVIHELPCPFGMVVTPAAFSLTKDGIEEELMSVAEAEKKALELYGKV